MNIESIIVHHSASRFGCARIIDEWHRGRGWRMIGYHAVIGNGRPFTGKDYLGAYDGLIELGRPHDFDSEIEPHERGAHAAALGLNSRTLGVCVIGSGMKDYTAPQLRALVDWLRLARSTMYHRHDMEPGIVGHKEVDARKPECPGLHMERLRTLVFGGMDHRIFDDRELKEHLEG